MNAKRLDRTSPARRLPVRRGMALLLVMIGLVICTILTAGFLSTQGTAIGIARNERDAAKAHGIAKTGIDMCYWLIRNKSDWRSTQSPGKWLHHAAIGDGTVSVRVDDDTGSFLDDTTQPVTLSATGAYDNRTFTYAATIRPTGGGTVFYDGNFINGNISLGGDLLVASTIDSYNSSIGAYNALFPGTNASFGSNAIGSSSLLVYFPSVFRGSYTAGPAAILSDVVGLLSGATGPSQTGRLLEPRNPGTVIFPNTADLPYRGSGAYSAATNLPGPGVYDNLSIVGCTVTVNTSGVYLINGNMTLSPTSLARLDIADGVAAVFVVRGNINLNAGRIQLLTATSQLALYVEGNVTLNNGSINNNGLTSRATLFGGSAGGNITITNTNGIMYGAVYAPQHDLLMQTNSPKFFGAVVAQSLTLKNSAALHFDEALRSLKISNITGGSAPGGNADYLISVVGGPGIR